MRVSSSSDDRWVQRCELTTEVGCLDVFAAWKMYHAGIRHILTVSGISASTGLQVQRSCTHKPAEAIGSRWEIRA